MSQREVFGDYDKKAHEKTDAQCSGENQQMYKEKELYGDRIAEYVALKDICLYRICIRTLAAPRIMWIFRRIVVRI